VSLKIRFCGALGGFLEAFYDSFHKRRFITKERKENEKKRLGGPMAEPGRPKAEPRMDTNRHE
jgi:hypothetical protein